MARANSSKAGISVRVSALTSNQTPVHAHKKTLTTHILYKIWHDLQSLLSSSGLSVLLVFLESDLHERVKICGFELSSWSMNGDVPCMDC